MLGKIKKLLSTCQEIAGFRIIEHKVEAGELFFVKKELDMNRVKAVHHFAVTVYKDFSEHNIKYRGSATANLHPTMNEEEIKQVIADLSFAAGFVKNQYYPLPQPAATDGQPPLSNFASHPISHWLPKITEAVFKNDIQSQGCLNSCELFLDKVYTRVINSEGIDSSFEGYKGQLEFITACQGKSEEIELYKNLLFAGYDAQAIAGEVAEMLALCKERACACPTPAVKKHTVLLTGEPVEEFLQYYTAKASAHSVYNKLSEAKLGENIQGLNVKGDLINLLLDPSLENSTDSAPFDEDGFPLKPAVLYENGILKKYWGDVRHCHYLNVEPTGMIHNIVVQGGKKSVTAMKQAPYLELVAFSDFQMDSLTGDFAGEIRLGWYFDGTRTIPVTGGSISGNIKEMQEEMYLSSELQKNNNYLIPRTIQLFNVAIAGAEN